MLWLARILEQLDLALEQLQERTPHNARFGLILTDNALEIALHRYARDLSHHLQEPAYHPRPYAYKEPLRKALNQYFEPKVRFARVTGFLSAEEAQTILTCHGFRNETYHVGVKHEQVIDEVARFYYAVTTAALARFQPNSVWWSHGDAIPERAKRYLTSDPFGGNAFSEFQAACQAMASSVEGASNELLAALKDHMAEVIDVQDELIEHVAQGLYEPITRDQVAINAQAWPLALSGKGATVMTEKGFTPSSIFAAVEWLSMNGDLLYPQDPLPSWRRRLSSLEAETDAYAALKKYRDFMLQSQPFRDQIEESAAGLDAEINQQVDMLRGG